MEARPITYDNLDLAVATHNGIFPYATARNNYLDAIEGRMDGEYSLLYNDDTLVGVSGIYFVKDDPEAAWLGWFGILPAFRRRYLGREALNMFERDAKARGFRYTRLYTDANNNEIAIRFYESNGYIPEAHNNKSDLAAAGEPLLIFSKSLDGSIIPQWHSRPLGMAEQMRKQAIPVID